MSQYLPGVTNNHCGLTGDSGDVAVATGGIATLAGVAMSEIPIFGIVAVAAVKMWNASMCSQGPTVPIPPVAAIPAPGTATAAVLGTVPVVAAPVAK